MGSTLNISRIFQHHLSTIFLTIFTSHKHEFTSCQVILQHSKWLTISHISYFRDVPLIQVSVEGGSPIKHCRNKKKADYIHTTTRKKRKVKHNPDQNTQTPQRRQTFFKLHTSRNRIQAKQEATFTYKTDYYHTSINPLLPNPYWKICGHKHVIS